MTGVAFERPLRMSHELRTPLNAVIGFAHHTNGAAPSATVAAARVIFTGTPQVLRPGTLTTASPATRTHRAFYDGSLGVWGRFHAYSMPQFEVFDSAAAASTSEGYLRVVRLAAPNDRMVTTKRGAYGR